MVTIPRQAKAPRALPLAVALVLALAAAPASAAILYKSMGPGGVMQFSDLPPEKSQKVERILIPDSAASGATVSVAVSDGMPHDDPAQTDAEVARANAQLDLAEHALAEARRNVNDAEPLRLVSTRMTRADSERVEFYKRNVLVARQTLLEILKKKRNADVAQTMTASYEWQPVSPIARR